MGLQPTWAAKERMTAVDYLLKNAKRTATETDYIIAKIDIEARNRVIESNLGLIGVALKNMERCHDVRRNPDDFIEAATRGLAKAAVKFDIARGFKFSSFAVTYIKIEIWHERQHYRAKKRSFALVTAEDASIWDTVKDHRESAPVELGRLNELVDVLTERELKLIKMRFGLESGKPMTLQAVGNIEGVNRERVRQLTDKALTRMRKAANERGLIYHDGQVVKASTVGEQVTCE